MKKFYLISFFILIVLGAIFSFSLKTKAASIIDVRGWAYSDSAGWISFNCKNFTLDNSLVLSADPDYDTCDTASYGVTLDTTTGILSGDAWSSHMGWLHFDTANVSVGSIADPLSGPNTYAAFDPLIPAQVQTPVTGNTPLPISGWARFCDDTFLSPNANLYPPGPPNGCRSTDAALTNTAVSRIHNGGWTGWVAMKGSTTGVPQPFGVQYNPLNGNFSGYAWGGTSVPTNPDSAEVGYISFNWVTTAIKPIPPTYYPVIDLTANPNPVPALGTTNLTYTWVSPGPSNSVAPDDSFSGKCKPYWFNFNTGSNEISSLPGWSGTPAPTYANPSHLNPNVYVYDAPSTHSTTYYILCLDGNIPGRYAIDDQKWAALGNTPPVNDGDKCFPDDAHMKNCPVVKVDVSSVGRTILLEGSVHGANSYSTGPISVNPGQTVDMRWSSPYPFTQCKTLSDTGVPPRWPIAPGFSRPDYTPSGYIYDNANPGISVVPSTTNYQITCLDSTLTPAPSNPVQVNVITPTDPFTFSELGDVTDCVNQTPIQLTWGGDLVSCSASYTGSPILNPPLASGTWAGSLASSMLSPAIPGPWFRNLTLPAGSTFPVNQDYTFTISCLDSSLTTVTQTLAPITVPACLPNPGPTVTITGCVKDNATPFYLNLNLSGFTSDTTCTLDPSAEVPNWDATSPITYPFASANASHPITGLSMSGPTTLHATCVDLDGNNDEYFFPLNFNPACTNPRIPPNFIER